MQDIGGCRAVVRGIDEVEALYDKYNKSRQAHELRNEKDYIASPKPDGYRSKHLIYSYKSARGANAVYNKLILEIKIRTSLQHAWATAVEAVGIFTRQALKANVGDDNWLRLFALMSAHIAAIEGTSTVPGTPENAWDRVNEIQQLARLLHARETLNAYRATINHLSKKAAGSKYYLIEYDYNSNTLDIEAFEATASQRANIAYTAAETKHQAGSKNVVLVSVDSINSLQKAYPNYFLDTQAFTEVLSECL